MIGPAAVPAPPPADATTWERLVQRRIPQIFGLYLGGSTSAVLFADWLVNRYALSPYLVDLFLWGLILLIPTVLLLAYKHGAPGPNRWTTRQFAGVLANVIGAVAVLTLAFWGKPLGATTQTVVVENEAGEQVERRVAKAAFRKRIGTFYFATETGADADLGRAVPLLFDADLEQDLYLQVWEPHAFGWELRRTVYRDGTGVPLALQLDLARKASLTHLLTGTVGRGPDGYTLRTVLYDADTGKRIGEDAYAGPDLYALVDEAAVALRHALDLPRQHVESTADFPVAEITTPSLDALRAYARGLHAYHYDTRPAEAIAALDAAVEHDPTFARAHFERFTVRMNENDQAGAVEALRQARQHDYRLPESLQFAVKTAEHFFAQRSDAALQTVQQWVELYPEDLAAYAFQGELYWMRGEPEAAIATYRRILELDPASASRHLTIGNLLRDELQRYDEALAEYRAYVEAFPDRDAGYRQIAHTHDVMGQLDSALVYHDRAFAVDPENTTILGNKAWVLLRLGRFDEAERQIEALRTQGQTPQEHAYALWLRAMGQVLRGQPRAALTTYRARWGLMREYESTSRIWQDQASRAADLAGEGLTTEAEALMAEVRQDPALRDGGFYAANVALAEAELAAELGRIEQARQHFSVAREIIDNYRLEQARDILVMFEGIVEQARGAWDEAAATFRQVLETNPHNVSTWFELGEVERARGRFEAAEEAYRTALRYHPASARTHLALATLLHERGRTNEARRHLTEALRIWAEAEPDYAPALETRTLDAALTGV